MATIEIDFDVYKELTVRRVTEASTYNDVLRELLGLAIDTTTSESRTAVSGGLELKGVFLPDGTQLRVTYKGKTYTAEIKNGEWVGSDGVQRATPSDAACAITQTNVNGWRFWKVKRPSDRDWIVLNALRPH